MDYPAIVNIREKCTACGACTNICPKNCIELQYDKEGFLMPQVDIEKCIGCGICEKACHIFVEQEAKPCSDFTAYAGWAKQDKIRYESSSGGFFSLLAQQVLDSGGVVFGAAYNYELKRLEHCSTESCGISALRKSKYIESNTLKTYSEVLEYLKDSREVLFCGTPCQISGLKRFLSLKKVDTSKLLLVDFICHGVPSTVLHAQWLTYLERTKLKGKITHIDFRSKSRGWSLVSEEYISENGRKINVPYTYDSFFQLFLANIALRKSCYKCKITQYHLSDITIADFWGRKGVVKDDNKGISLAIINSPVGQLKIENIEKGDDVFVQKLDAEDFKYVYKERNSEAFSIAKREATYQLIEKIGYVETLKKLYGRQIAVLKIKNIIKRIIGWKR